MLNAEHEQIPEIHAVRKLPLRGQSGRPIPGPAFLRLTANQPGKWFQLQVINRFDQPASADDHRHIAAIDVAATAGGIVQRDRILDVAEREVIAAQASWTPPF
jgi:hypothetical protein